MAAPWSLHWTQVPSLLMIHLAWEQDSTAVFRRRRPLYALAVAGTIALGLASRRFPFLGKYPGDAFWALMVFFALGFVFPKARSARLALVAALVSGAVEFLKLNQTPWLVSLRQTTLGQLVFGHVFSWQNLVAYAVGISVGLLLEHGFARRSMNRAGS